MILVTCIETQRASYRVNFGNRSDSAYLKRSSLVLVSRVRGRSLSIFRSKKRDTCASNMNRRAFSYSSSKVGRWSR